jgi:hypothetical protein
MFTPTNNPISKSQRETARADIRNYDFDVLVQQKGLSLILESAVKCPCNREFNGSPLSNCVNCNGSGFQFVDAIQLKGVIQGIGYSQKFMEYSEANQGTARLTVRYIDRLAWMDRITVIDGTTVFGENIFPTKRERNGQIETSSLLTYKPTKMTHVFLFVDEKTPTISLVENVDYFIDGRKFIFATDLCKDSKLKVGERAYVSVRYEHNPQYLVMDVQNEIRNTVVILPGGAERVDALPLSAIIKKVHYLIGDKGFNV